MLKCERCQKEFDPLFHVGRWSCRYHPGVVAAHHPGGPLLHSCCGQGIGTGSTKDVRGCTRCDHQLPLSLEQPFVWIPHLVPGVRPLPEAIIATVDASLDTDYYEAAKMMYRTLAFAESLPTPTILRLKKVADQMLDSQAHTSTWDPRVGVPDDEDENAATHPPPTASALTFVYEYWVRTLKRAPVTLTRLVEQGRFSVKVDVVRRYEVKKRV